MEVGPDLNSTSKFHIYIKGWIKAMTPPKAWALEILSANPGKSDLLFPCSRFNFLISLLKNNNKTQLYKDLFDGDMPSF